MSPDVLSPRQRLIETLSGDLNAGPWDQMNKFWYMKGTPEDEWLEYAGEFRGSAENRLLDVIIDETMPDDAHGILVAMEGWDYPQALAASLKAKGESALRAYWALYPPSEHPQRVETRTLVLTCSDGEVIGLTVRHDAQDARDWAYLDSTTPCPTGNRAIDTARALLGQYPELLDRLAHMDGLKAMKAVTDVMERAIDGELDPMQTTKALLEAIPEEQRQRMVADMPEDIRAALRGVLSEEDVDKYGL